jgi:hypothetical protein
MTRTPDAWEIVAAPIHYIKAPRRLSPVLLTLAGIAFVCGVMVALEQIYEVMK